MPDQTPYPTADHDLLIEVSANVKNLNATLTAYTAASSKVTQDHEIRIRTLESDNQALKGSQRTLKGLLGLVSAIATIAATIIAFFALK